MDTVLYCTVHIWPLATQKNLLFIALSFLEFDFWVQFSIFNFNLIFHFEPARQYII